MTSPINASAIIEQAINHALSPLTHVTQVVVAFSGGVDSVVLLHAITHAQTKFAIKAVYVNHGLSPSANAWEQHCQTVCQQLNVHFNAVKVCVDDTGNGIEAAARDARMAVFEGFAASNTVVVTGHHLADQAETVLHRLCRGAGLQGLQGMPSRRSLYHKNQGGQGVLLRPLLNVSKQVINDYAALHGLSHIEDESNEDTRFTRNFLRHRIMGQLKIKWPQIEQNIARAASHMQASQTLLNSYLHADYITLKPQKILFGHSIQIDVLHTMPVIKQTHLLRYWLGKLNLPMPSQAQLEEVLKLLSAKMDACPEIHTRYYSFRRFQGRLACLRPLISISAQTTLTWDVPSEVASNTSSPPSCRLPDGSLLLWCAQNALQPSAPFTIRFRQGGERSQPLGRAHSQTLKKLFQAYGVPPWLRDRIPLIYYHDQLLAVGDVWICTHSATRELDPHGEYKIIRWRD